MTIDINLLQNLSFKHTADLMAAAKAAPQTVQTQQLQDFEIQNGYGTATTVSISPGFGATVDATIDIDVTTVTSQTFDQMINEVKNSQSYQNNKAFRSQVDSASCESAASRTSGVFGFLIGRKSSSYKNNKANLTKEVDAVNSGHASNDTTVANTVASIMVSNTSKVNAAATVSVTGQLLVPVDASTQTVSKNTVAAGTKLTLAPITPTI
ncbi:MAG: hypothetical protein ACI8S6_000670 [Myxococcota bacterium]|jgi:hypothetical protein